MLFNKDIPYKPKAVVYFIHENAIRKGVVQSVSCTLTTQGESRCWNINEYFDEDRYYTRRIKDLLLIANTSEEIMNRANKSIKNFILADHLKDNEEDIFA
jgi:hypothetical protein